MGVADHAKAALAEKQGGNGKNKLPEKASIKTLAGMKSDAISEMLNVYKLQIANVLPKHLTPERVLQLATTLVSRNPDIKACTLPSIVGAVMNAAMLGLDLTPQFGECYFIPYNNSKTGAKELEFQVGYKGWLKLFRNTGQIANVYAECVREGDDFDVQLGLKYDLQHHPNYGKRGKLIFTYCVVKFKDGSYNFKVLAEADVYSRRSRSKSYMTDIKYKTKKSPWFTDEEAMWNKSVVLAIRPFIPSNTELAQAAITDGAIITPEMFDSKTKSVDLDKVEEAEAEIMEDQSANNEALEEPKEEEIDKGDGTNDKVNDEKPANKKADAADPRNEFYAMARPLMEKILKTRGSDFFADLLQQIGYSNLQEVPEKNFSKVIDALQNVVDSLNQKE